MVSMLCDLYRPVISDQNAAAWGYFNCVTNQWNTEVLENVDFPVHLLPEVRKTGTVVGNLADNWHSLPKGTPIGTITI